MSYLHVPGAHHLIHINAEFIQRYRLREVIAREMMSDLLRRNLRENGTVGDLAIEILDHTPHVLKQGLHRGSHKLVSAGLVQNYVVRVRCSTASGMKEAQLDAVVNGTVDVDKRVPLGAEEIDGIGGGGGIVSLAHQVGFFVFESGSHFHLIADSQEQRTRVMRESRSQVPRSAARSNSLSIASVAMPARPSAPGMATP